MPGRMRAPALQRREVKEPGHLTQIGQNRDRTGDEVEQDVPLGAQQHKQNGRDAHTSTEANKTRKQDGKQRSGRHRSRNLRQWLCNAGKARVEPNRDAPRDGPSRG